jgi:hypothetical protein
MSLASLALLIGVRHRNDPFLLAGA